MHFLTSIPKYQHLEALSDRTGLKKEILLNYLQQLETQGYIENKNNKWVYKSGEFHAAKDSPLVMIHHQNWRARALLDAQSTQNESVHYTAVQTMSIEDAEKIKDLLLTFISESSQIAGPSNPEEGVVITCDFFKI